jgi:polyamine oxidase
MTSRRLPKPCAIDSGPPRRRATGSRRSSQSAGSSVARRARQGLLAEIEADAGDCADEQSLRWLEDEAALGGESLGDLPRGGYRAVVDALAAGVDITLNAQVVRVDVDADGIRVICADGSVERGSHAIVTVPLGVLKQGSPQFDPPLPMPMQAAIRALGFGRYEKIALRFETAFWRQDGISHLMVYSSDPEEPTLWVFDLDAFGAGPVLCAHRLRGRRVRQRLPSSAPARRLTRRGMSQLR